MRRASKIEAWGLLGAILAPRQLRTVRMTFLGRSRLPQKEPFWKPFRLMLPSRGALRLKIKDFGGVWLQSLFLKRFYEICGRVLDDKNVDFAWER